MFASDNEIQLNSDLANGSINAFDTLYQRYHNFVYANILKFIYRHDIAEDILQDVFVALWENRSIFRSDTSVGGWLFVVSRNKSLSYLKKQISEKKAVSAYINTMAGDETVDEKKVALQETVLLDAIDTLTPQKKEVYTLCRLNGMTYVEAAMVLKISPELVKERLKAASKTIRNHATLESNE